jgi:hypothetical protein
VARRHFLLAVAVALAPASALAQKETTRVVVATNIIAATVNEDGKLVPLNAEMAPERIAASPRANVKARCPDIKALTIDDAKALVSRVATREKFYPEFVGAVAKTESQFNSIALSDKGAYGLMQLEPETASRFKVDICDPADNVLGGVRFLRDLHEHYKNPLFILSAYNAGEETLLRYRGVPPYPETVKFVASVMNEFYDWPSATARQPLAPRGARAATRVQAHLAEQRPVPSTQAQITASDGWSEGFVKHID